MKDINVEVDRVQLKLRALRASHETVIFQIKSLGFTVPVLQLRLWKDKATLLVTKIEFYEDKLKQLCR